MSLIDWALGAEIKTSEKLVLVYLARHANTAGIGGWNRDELDHKIGFERRTIQRLLKSLRDQNLLIDHGAWYGLNLPDRHEALDQPFDKEVIDELPDELVSGDNIYSRPEDVAGFKPGMPQIDGDKIGELIAGHMVDASEYLMDQLSNFEARFAKEIERMALLHVERAPLAPPPPPPPHPVLSSAAYIAMIAAGLPEKEAYKAVETMLAGKQLLDDDATADDAKAEAPPVLEEVGPGLIIYEDTPKGRASRIMHALEGSIERLTEAHLAAWQLLEATENKHTVAGEVAAFELIYPAIVDAARTKQGQMTFEQFMEPEAIEQSRAPWDQDPDPNPMEDVVLEAEISTMLAELGLQHDPRCEVQPRVTEIGADGSHLIESISTYHRRVQAVYQQMQRLTAMGAM